MGLMFSGIDLKSTYNFVVTKVDGRGSPPVSRDVLDMPRVDGDIEINSKLKSRNLVISGYVYGTDAATKKDNLIKLITQAYSQEKELKFPDTNRSIYVKLAGEPIVIGPVGPVLNAQAYEITFNFVAQDPYFYADEHNESGWGYIKVNADAPTYLVSPRRQFLKREPEFEIYPITIVNLHGKYGNFESDSNDDGLADGWYININLIYDVQIDTSSVVFGSQAQKLIPQDNVAGTYIANAPIFSPVSGHKYFVSIYAKANTGTNRVIGIRGSSLFTSAASTLFKRYYKALDVSSAVQIEYRTADDSATLTTADWVIFDGAMMVDLTAMGELPTPLKEFFQNQVTNWADLATTSNITAIDGRTQTGEDWLAELLPYVDSVATLGYSYVDGQLNVTTENRGKNLWQFHSIYFNAAENSNPTRVLNLGTRLRTVITNYWYVSASSSKYPNTYIPVKPNTTYTISFQREIISHDENTIRETVLEFDDNLIRTTERQFPSSLNSGLVTLTFTTTADTYFVALRLNRSVVAHTATVDYWNFQLEEGSTATLYEPPRNSAVDFTGELWGYDGIYDQVFENGNLLKQWQRETGISISGGSGTISEPGRGTCILIDETTGLPYTGTVSSTSISTSAPDGTYMVIYQLKTSTVKSLDYNGELILYPGTNYIILPDHAVASISGNRKYLEG